MPICGWPQRVPVPGGAFEFTYAMLRIIDMFTTVKVDEMSEEIGLDESIHGERAYEDVAGQAGGMNAGTF